MVQKSIGDEMDTVRHKRYWKIQDGGHQTASTYNSASRLDRNAIPMATERNLLHMQLSEIEQLQSQNQLNQNVWITTILFFGNVLTGEHATLASPQHPAHLNSSMHGG